MAHSRNDQADGSQADAPQADDPSKSELKRQSHELQALGEALIALPEAELAELSLPDALRDAVLLARRITAHGGLYRQKQYIGKLMRKIDAAPIRAALTHRNHQQRQEAQRQRRIENWRTRLLRDGPPAVDALLAEQPHIDRARLEELVIEAQREASLGRPPRAFRELFALIRSGMLVE